ncbi:SurA N-terminal domain-containing protein [Blastococcus sp. TBT05-19]|uniref:SurA N-terminal domain-containing protein n=1 Tax=Blastococcus sp. TBT05-19 TaxID=2250581 RepID=UPI001314DED6|nr:SurA N-terminal domain-containing protein [Blastococcus sp. TBT05-19]
MLTRRPPRTRAAVLLVAAALPILAGCRSAPDVAAYVGDERITVTELEAAVRERLADDGIAAWAEGREDELTQRVLGTLVDQEVYAAAAERYDVDVDDADVSRRIDELLGDDDPDAAYEALAAQQGIGRADVRATVRQQLVRRELAAREGEAGALEEEALRARYEEVRSNLATLEFGYVTVPDQATADALLAELTAAPGRYAELAARYPGQYTLPELRSQRIEEIPPLLAEQLQMTPPGSGFTLPVPEVGGVVVGLLVSTEVPSFAETRAQLEEEAAGPADAAGGELVRAVREDLGVTVNPRYELRDAEGRLAPVEGGVVDLLDDATADPAAGAAD